jgi:hypothetical protein
MCLKQIGDKRIETVAQTETEHKKINTNTQHKLYSRFVSFSSEQKKTRCVS